VIVQNLGNNLGLQVIGKTRESNQKNPRAGLAETKNQVSEVLVRRDQYCVSRVRILQHVIIGQAGGQFGDV
jgi:hypothetical protein